MAYSTKAASLNIAKKTLDLCCNFVSDFSVIVLEFLNARQMYSLPSLGWTKK